MVPYATDTDTRGPWEQCLYPKSIKKCLQKWPQSHPFRHMLLRVFMITHSSSHPESVPATRTLSQRMFGIYKEKLSRQDGR